MNLPAVALLPPTPNSLLTCQPTLPDLLCCVPYLF